MQAAISERLIRGLRPMAKPYEVRDTRLRGFLLRVQPSGVMTYYAEYGRGRRYRLGRADTIKPEKAREEARTILADAQLGRDPMEAKRKARAHTLRSFVNEVYAPWAEANVRTYKNTLLRLRSDFPDLQTKKLGEITPWLVEKWRAARLKDGARASTVNRALDDLRSALSKAVVWGHLEANPIASVKRSRTDGAAKVRFLSDDEHKALLSALDAREERIRAERDRANAWRHARGYELLPDLRQEAFADHLKPMVLLSINTGMRRGEVFALRWADVELDRSMVTVRGETAKSMRTRHLPLNATARDALKGWREQAPDPEGLIFPGRKAGSKLNNVRKGWEAVLDAAGIRDFRWHDLRHTFASRLVMAGVDLNTVRELLGHSTIAMTLRYAHLAPEHRAAAVARLETAS